MVNIVLVLLAIMSVGVLFRAHGSGFAALEYAAKPLAMISIGLIAILAWPPVSEVYQMVIVAGLAISLIGDIFLMLPRDRFMAGLTAFLIAHIAYVYAFWGRLEQLPILPFLPYLLAFLFLSGLLWPHLGSERIPVLIYGAVVALMAGSALGVAVTIGGVGPWMAAAGAFLFVISDVALAFGRFIRRDDASFYVVGGTYFAAQVLIALSVTS